MNKESKSLTSKQIFRGVAICFVVTIALSLFHKDSVPLILGVVFGLTLSLLNFRLLYLTLNKAVQLPPEKAKSYASSRYMLRYIITGVCLFVSIRAPYINVLGTIVGLLLIKIVIFVSNALHSGDLLRDAFTPGRSKNL